MERVLRILILEDSPDDAELLVRELRHQGVPCETLRVAMREEFVQALESFAPGVVLVDYKLPGFDGMEAVRIVRLRSPDLPCIVVSGSIGEERAVEILRAGATDYILKGRWARLGPAVERAVREATLREERRRLEIEVRQIQKMEAIGQLAGGVAHDFNNLLTVISGYVDLALMGIPAGDPMHRKLTEVRNAGVRAAALTRQLLSFSRKQVIHPRVLDLNAVVEDVEKMLRRLIGEDIEFVTLLAPGPIRILADAGQVEQVLLNLSVNARDAMPKGGRLTIETRVADLDHGAALLKLLPLAGPHAVLRVTDDGIGMDEATKSRIFEPFFTTKPKDHGTGLGLATVFGIVRQAGGSIVVQSRPGAGATFEVFLPIAAGEVEPAAASSSGARPAGGTESILVVEDNEQVRALACAVLRGLGYSVQEASHPDEGLERLPAGAPGPALLLTDVVMPGKSGRDLAREVAIRSPGTRVLYMSGHTENTIDRHGVLEAGIHFLPKPFAPDVLARRVREVLDGPARAPGA